MTSKVVKIIIVGALAASVSAIIAFKQRQVRPPLPQTTNPRPAKGLPRLLELGSDKCIPCRMMAPLLEELKSEYAGRLRVEFVDVLKTPERGQEYGVRIIPTQIFFDASGKEVFRHQGFFPKDDIVAKWKELGINIEGGQKNEKSD
ncbi:MAG: thioredoxin family protein [Planctomycetota bacterium]|jgi:thioredoxin 1